VNTITEAGWAVAPRSRHEIWREWLHECLDAGLIIDAAQALWSGDAPEMHRKDPTMPDDQHYLRLAVQLMMPEAL
jgi:hypothetical protein